VIVARIVVTKVLVPVVKRFVVPVLKKVGSWVGKKIWVGLAWFARKVGIAWTWVVKQVRVLVVKLVRVWIPKLIKKIVKSKIWKEAKKKVAKWIGKKNVERIKKAVEKVKKVWKKAKEKHKERKKPRKKQKEKAKEPTPELVAIGKRDEKPGASESRPGDYERVGDDVLGQTGEGKPKGLSSYDTEENLRKRVSGQMWKLPAGTILPDGLDWVNDNDPEGHHTIYATRKMSFEEYKSLLNKLDWQYQKNVKKPKGGK
jgi:hypothetical protein